MMSTSTPIRISKAEYEAKFGVKPVVQADTFDTTPSPIRISRAEYNKKFGIEQPATTPTQDLQKANTEILSKTQGDMASSRQRFMSGEISAPKTIFQQGGSLLNAGFSVAFETLKNAAKVVLPKSAEDGIANLVQGFVKEGADYNTRFVDKTMSEGTPEQKQSLQTILDAKQTYDTDPNFKADVDASFGYLNLLGVKPGASVTKATVDAAKTIPDVISPIVKQGSEMATKFQDSRQASKITSVIDEIAKIENKYSPIRKANSFSKDTDQSRRRIAESNVLENAIDENGKLDTTDAVTAYRAATLDGREDLVRKTLENEGKSINIKELADDLRAGILDSGLEADDLATALRGVQKAINGLVERGDPFGNIPLHKLQDAKISAYRYIDFNTPGNVKAFKKSLARTYKEVIESKSQSDVKLVNAELAKYYGDIERLEMLNGRLAEGGKLSKYTAAITGTAIGMGAGSVGGGLGAAVGGIVGGEAARFIKGKAMAGTLNKGIKGNIPENAILNKAKAEADAGSVRNLKKADAKVGVGQSIKKTAEMKKVEAQIARNVELQKKAIKAGDFTLVSVLKDIYENLVEKLKILIKDYKENGIPIGMSIRDITKSPGYKPTSAKEAIAKGLTEDEYVKGQGDVIYRGVSGGEKTFTPSAKGIFKDSGFSIARDSKTARRFGTKVIEGRISPNAKIKDLGLVMEDVDSKIILAKKNGFDAIEFSSYDTSGEITKEILVINPKAVKTTSQLRAEYQAAKGGNTNLLEEAKKSSKPYFADPNKIPKTESEFIEAHTLFHGANTKFADQLEKTRTFKPGAKREAGTGGNFFGLSASTDFKMAKDFSTSATGQGRVVELYINPKAKVFNLKGRALDDLTEKETKELAKEYDIIRDLDNTGGESEVRVLNPDVLRDKSQIESAWSLQDMGITNLYKVKD